MQPDQSCSVIIPVYNSQDSLPELVQKLVDFMPTISTRYEIILVNDGSRDHSWSVIQELAQQDNHVTGINLMRNYGQHNALLCGIRNAKNDIIITMDDDLQHPPGEITKLLIKLDEGYDVVYGSPDEEVHSFWRNLSSQLLKWALKITIRIPYAEKISAFRAFRTSLRDIFINYSNSYVSIDVLLSWGSGKIGFVKVRHDERKLGKSQYTFYKLLRHMSNMVLGYSVVPLRIASILGFSFTVFGIGVLFYVVIRYLFSGGAVPGFAFLASTISIFAGIQLFVLGIMGEYLARMYTNILAKPPYVIYKQV